MAKKIDNAVIEQIQELYAKLGTYSAVAKELGISASTVSKYLKKQSSSASFSEYSGPQPNNEPPSKEAIITFSTLSQNEKDSFNEFYKECGISNVLFL